MGRYRARATQVFQDGVAPSQPLCLARAPPTRVPVPVAGRSSTSSQTKFGTVPAVRNVYALPAWWTPFRGADIPVCDNGSGCAKRLRLPPSPRTRSLDTLVRGKAHGSNQPHPTQEKGRVSPRPRLPEQGAWTLLSKAKSTQDDSRTRPRKRSKPSQHPVSPYCRDSLAHLRWLFIH